MATILDLARMSSNAYNGTSSPNQNTGIGSQLLNDLTGWQVLTTTSQQYALHPQGSNYWNDGYFGAAYYNPTTGEVVIANRGTDLDDGVSTAYKNLKSDAELARGGSSRVHFDASRAISEVVVSMHSGVLHRSKEPDRLQSTDTTKIRHPGAKLAEVVTI